MECSLIKEREQQVFTKGRDNYTIASERGSAAGSVSQRACVFCGSRVVLYPIADALHLVHGPIGCASYTWDIRGALSSGPELHRRSFSTDLRENDVIFGGEGKLYKSLKRLIPEYKPNAVFVYSTCIVGIIGDDVEAVCSRTAIEEGIPVIPVHSEGFRGTKKEGYRAACSALLRLIELDDELRNIETGSKIKKIINTKPVINILGEFNLAGEAWIIKDYYKKMGVEVGAVLTGDGRVDEVKSAWKADLNVVQCSGSLKYLAKDMEDKFGIPFKQVSFFGIEDTADALYTVAEYFSEKPEIAEKTRELVQNQLSELYPVLEGYRKDLAGKKAAVYVGGAFKAFSMLRSLKFLGVSVVLMGSQTGSPEEYEEMKDMADPGTVIVDDSNPSELSRFIIELDVDLFVGGVKERPMAFKLGVAFCDHNHERKTALAGFEGMFNFAKEVHKSLMSPVWQTIGESKENDPWKAQ
ncbi:MAG: nitrogenase iron-molybdenum cofactor biosynthesis protein NifE [Spirochaetales bacterium]|uniref:Nitrogenase iron-molybdenum cofactor biosynthesis protein NifE n=1 Tax=Candidatus Thalassospirochaeta sargassi TaxID=3119039 RepID=A0AAJ1I9F9_9SPIO|nr:nitrogenase iron-molybdenum cofactor biosynthesis protein NifE [Spirochaetales bacterium]